MKTYRDECEQRAKLYCEKRFCEPLFNSQLGWGQEGYVWETSQRSAIKVYRENGEINFNREFRCYRILAEHGITELKGFNIPQMIDSESRLLVIEMTIVSAPYILDFGKANFAPHDFIVMVGSLKAATASQHGQQYSAPVSTGRPQPLAQRSDALVIPTINALRG